MNKLDEKILVTGGSGSLGRHVLRELLHRGAKHVVSLSRDEGLIKEAKAWLGSSSVQFVLGDISDQKVISQIVKDVKLIIHTAALKDVINAEQFPREILKVNIGGIINLLDHSSLINRFIHISSDKAIGVMNCYGASKLLAEYLIKETNTMYPGKFINIRCPNFFGSRGSVLDVWRYTIKYKNVIEVTDPDMTRFCIRLPDAAKFITNISLQPQTSSDTIYYPLSYTKKFRVGDLGNAFLRVYGNSKTKIVVTGKRQGEKMHEDYVTSTKLLTESDLVSMIKRVYA